VRGRPGEIGISAPRCDFGIFDQRFRARSDAKDDRSDFGTPSHRSRANARPMRNRSAGLALARLFFASWAPAFRRSRFVLRAI
jgi:hypothetical protein